MNYNDPKISYKCTTTGCGNETEGEGILQCDPCRCRRSKEQTNFIKANNQKKEKDREYHRKRYLKLKEAK
jgi:hypothetical protein